MGGRFLVVFVGALVALALAPVVLKMVMPRAA